LRRALRRAGPERAWRRQPPAARRGPASREPARGPTAERHRGDGPGHRARGPGAVRCSGQTGARLPALPVEMETGTGKTYVRSTALLRIQRCNRTASWRSIAMGLIANRIVPHDPPPAESRAAALYRGAWS